MKKNFRSLVKITLVLVYLVIVAGATVRMTGSGMGCPDWPKCFGYYIPPVEAEQLSWQPGRAYKKGQVIIVDEALYVAQHDFTTTTHYNEENWAAYTKHDYAVFNPYHTWVEYINRLIGALAGLFSFIMAMASLRFWKKKKSITLLSWLVVIAMGFQGWLGAVVVYSVLAPVKVTLHLAVALGIVSLILYILHLIPRKSHSFKYDRRFKGLMLLALVLTVVQIILGTQVRQFVDEQIKRAGEEAGDLWLQYPPLKFYVHRSFSVLVFLLNGLLFVYNRKKRLGYFRMKYVMVLLLIEILSGIGMNYAGFPFGSQAAHLIVASLLFGVQFYLLLDTGRRSQPYY